MIRKIVAASGITGILAIAGSTAFAAAENAEGTSFGITPYVWGANVDGTFSPSRVAPDADVDANFGDTDQWDEGWGLAGDARWGRFGLMAEYGKLGFSDSADIPGGSADFDLDTELVNLSAYYRVDSRLDMDVDLFVGGRWWNVETDLDLGPGAGASRDTDWTDLIVGARIRYQPGPNWFFKGLGDYGSGDSDETWQVYAAGGYQFTPNWSAELGWRMLSVDYEEDGFLYDVTHDGLLAGLEFKF